MPRPRKPANPFRYFNSSPEVIRPVVMMYVRFPLSLRNVEDLLFESGIDICHETVRLWWNRFGPMFAGDIRRQRVSRMKGFRHWRWHLNEMYVRLNDEMVYLWRAIDHEGEILESYVTKKRDKFALPELYDFLEAEHYLYAIRLKSNSVLQARIAHLLRWPVGRPSAKVRRFHASFAYRAASWSHARRVVAKVEWHPGELYPRVGFIVTNLKRDADSVVAFYNQRGTAEQWIKEGKNAVKWTRLSCRTMQANAVRLQLHVLAYNLSNFLRTLALPEEVQHWSLTSMREKLVKIGAKLVSHAQYAIFQMAEVAVPRNVFSRILANIADLRCREPAPC